MKRKWTWLCFALCYFGYAGLYICRNNLSIISPQLASSGFATEAQIGLLTGLFSLGYAAGKVLCGPFGDRFNPKNVAAAGIATTGVSNLLIALSMCFFPSFPLTLFLWIVNSFGQSLVWGPMLRLTSLNFSEERAPFVSSMLVTTTASGGVLGILIASAVGRENVAMAFLVPGLVTTAAALILFLGFPGKTKDGTQKAKPRGGMLAALRLKEVRQMLIPAFAQGVIKDNVLNWAALYLAARFLLDLRALPFFVLLIPVVSLIGRLCYPFVYRLCRHDQVRITQCCFIGCLVLSLLLILGWFSAVPALVLLVLIAMLGNIMNTSFVSIFPISMAHTGLVSTIVSLMDVVVYSGLGLSSALFGVLIGKFGLIGYQLMFGIFALVALIGFTLLFLSKKSQVVQTH